MENTGYSCANNLKEVTVMFNNTSYNTVAAKDEANYSLKDAAGNTIAIDSVKVDGTKAVLVLDSSTVNQTEASLTVNKAVLAAEVDSTTSFTFFDSAIPVAQNVELVAPNQFKITFNEPVNTTGTVEVENGIYGVTSAAANGTNEVLVTLSANSLSEGTYKVKVSGYKDFAGYTALTKEFTLNYAADKVAPTAMVKEASQTKVVVKFDERVTDANGDALDLDYFYHTFTAYKPDSVQVSTDGTEYTLNFNTNPLPEGNIKVVLDYDANDSVVQDAWGNKMSANAELTASVTADKVAPTVSNINVEDEKTIEVSFSEDVTTASAQKATNYVFKNSKGETVTPTGIVYTSDSSKKEYIATASFVSDLKGDYTVEVKNVEDKALTPNKLVAVTKAFNVADLTGPVLADTTSVGVEGTNADYIYVTFPEKMATSGQYSVLNKSNYLIGGEALKSTDKVEIFKDSNKVKITVADKTRFDFSTGAVELKIGRVADVAGNTSISLAETITVSADVTPEMTKVKQLDYKTIEITIDQPLQTVVASGFSVVANGNTETLAAVSYSVNEDNETVVTGTLKSATQVSKTNTADMITSVSIVADKLISETGFVVEADTFNVIDDAYKPTLVATNAIMDADTANDGKFEITFTEALSEDNVSFYSQDLVITDKDGKVLTAGTGYTTALKVSAGPTTVPNVLVVTLTDATDATYKVMSKDTITYITDVDGNKAVAFPTAKEVTID